MFNIITKSFNIIRHWVDKTTRALNKITVCIEAVLTSTHNLCFEQKYEKYQNFLSEKLSLFGGTIFSGFEYACFRNAMILLADSKCAV